MPILKDPKIIANAAAEARRILESLSKAVAWFASRGIGGEDMHNAVHQHDSGEITDTEYALLTGGDDVEKAVTESLPPIEEPEPLNAFAVRDAEIAADTAKAETELRDTDTGSIPGRGIGGGNIPRLDDGSGLLRAATPAGTNDSTADPALTSAPPDLTVRPGQEAQREAGTPIDDDAQDGGGPDSAN